MENPIKFSKATTSGLLYFLLVIVLPIVTLALVGLVFLWQKNLLLLTTALWLLAAAIAYAALVYWPKHTSNRLTAASNEHNDNHLDESLSTNEQERLLQQLPTRLGWTPKDCEVWEDCCSLIEAQLQNKPDWQALPELALEQLAHISSQYHGSKKNAQLHFTVPEPPVTPCLIKNRQLNPVINGLADSGAP